MLAQSAGDAVSDGRAELPEVHDVLGGSALGFGIAWAATVVFLRMHWI